MTITNAPAEFSYLNNTIPVLLTEAGTNFRRILYFVTVDSVASEEYESLREADNTALLDISDLLKKYFDISAYPLPNLAASGIDVQANQTALIKAYTLTAKGQFTTGADSTQTTTKSVLWGGVSYRQKSIDTMLIGSNANTFPALTSFTTKTTTPAGKEYVNFANIFLANTPSSNVLEYTLYNQAGNIITSGTSSITFIQKGKTSLLDLSYSKVCTPYTSQTVYSYTVRIKAVYSATNYYSPLLTFQVNHAYRPQASEFLFINSRGGLSVARVFGQRDDDFEVTREEASRYLLPTATLPATANFARALAEKEVFEISTGYYDTWTDDYLIFKDMFKSQGIWEIVGTTLLPVQITSKSLPTYSSNRVEPAAGKLQFKYLMSNHSL